jgi:hypothetical protein
MTTTLSAALRMPHTASVAAPAPLALGLAAEPCATAAAVLTADHPRGLGMGVITAPALTSRLGGTDSSDRFGGTTTRSTVGGGWNRQEQAQLAGGGPLRE